MNSRHELSKCVRNRDIQQLFTLSSSVSHISEFRFKMNFFSNLHFLLNSTNHKLRMGGAVPPLPNTPSWRGAQLGGAQGQLYLTFTSICYAQ